MLYWLIVGFEDARGLRIPTSIHIKAYAQRSEYLSCTNQWGLLYFAFTHVETHGLLLRRL